MSKLAVTVILILVLSAAAWLILGGRTSPAPPSQPVLMPKATPPNELDVSLNTQNKSNELGIARLTETNDKLVVHLDVKGEDPQASQPVNIYKGSCPNPDVIKYPLTLLVKGVSETTLDIKLADLKKALPLAIVIHQSPSQLGVYVVCGDVKFP